MKKITLILTSMLFLLVGGVFSQEVTTLYLNGGQNWTATDGTNSWGNNSGSSVTYTAGDVTMNAYGRNLGNTGLTGSNWCAPFTEGEIHTFKIELNEAPGNNHFELVGGTKKYGSFEQSTDLIVSVIGETDTEATLVLNHNYDGVYLLNNTTSGETIKIKSITRTVTSGGGGGGSASEGKTAVSYDIPHEVNTAKYTYTFENGDNISTTGFSSTNNQSTDELYQSSKNLWLKNDNSKDHPYDSQVYINLNPSEWPVGTKAILHFAMKAADGFNANGGSMEIAFQQNSDNNTTKCGIFSTGMVPTSEWKEYNLETTVTNDAARCEKLYFNCGEFSGSFRFDDIILYKVEEKATGGDTHFTTDDQVANIASTEFSGLNEGDYICADVTGTPGTIKLVCNNTDYDLTQFNDGTLWGIKATAAMVTALKANDSQFKGHDLTLNGIDIYKTVALGEGVNSTALASKINNVFVELTRNFTGGTWNTVCLPFVPSAEQATELFGSGYKLAEFTASGTDKMTFTTIDLENESFVAGKPYLVYPTASLSHSNKVLANVSITETEGSEDGDNSGYKFKGSFEPTTFSSNLNLNLYRFIASGNELMTPTVSTLKSLRCYFEYPSGGNARSFVIDEEGGTTGINAVNGEGFMVNGYYNLNGQRVAKPTKGLYIVNGKKVVIK